VGARDQLDESGVDSEEGVGRRPASAAAVHATDPAEARFSPAGILALQRAAGNAATGVLLRRMLARQSAVVDVPEVQIEGTPWTTDDTKAIQRELRRLRLYGKAIDGIVGFFTEQGLTEAFGGDSWQTMEVADLIDRLRAAQRPAHGGGHALRYAELFQDGVLDVTLGLGFREGHTDDMQAMVGAVGARLSAMGFTNDDRVAADVLKKTGRSVSGDSVSTFWVKPNAFAYSPPAGTSIGVDAVVRIVANIGGDRGAEAANAFRAAMVQGDVAYYFGHARFGSGPDFDRNFAGFDLIAADGSVQPIDPQQGVAIYSALELALRAEGDPWTVFQRRIADGTLVAHLSNAGNVWLNDRNPHANDPGEGFGSRLMYWALAQDRDGPETGAGGTLAAGPDVSGRNYRVVAFAGCSTRDFEASLRATPGFDTRSADIVETSRVINLAGAGTESFVSFLNDVMAEASGEGIVRDMNEQMRQHEGMFTGPAFRISGIADNPQQ
jgi:hypothetical protein